MINTLVNFYKRNNSQNMDKQPIKFLVNNQNNIYTFYALTFWLGGIVISSNLLFR